MRLPVKLQNKIIDFLISLPNIHDSESQRALLYRAGLDPQLQSQIPIGKPPAQFIPSLVSILLDYGNMSDNRQALEALLEAAKSYIGKDRKVYCEELLKGLRTFIERKKSIMLRSKKDRTNIQNKFEEDSLFERLNNINNGFVDTPKEMSLLQERQLEEQVWMLTSMSKSLSVEETKVITESILFKVASLWESPIKKHLLITCYRTLSMIYETQGMDREKGNLYMKRLFSLAHKEKEYMLAAHGLGSSAINQFNLIFSVNDKKRQMLTTIKEYSTLRKYLNHIRNKIDRSSYLNRKCAIFNGCSRIRTTSL